MAEATSLVPRRPRSGNPSAGVDKAAILLLTLGPEAAARVFSHLTEGEVRQLSTAIARVRTIPRHQAAAVHEEAWRWLSNREGLLIDGERFVRELVDNSASSSTPQGQEVMRELARTVQAGTESFGSRMEDVAPGLMAQTLAEEHPQVIAFVLAHLQPRQAAEVLGALPEPMRPEIMHRVAGLKSVPDELVAEVGSVLHTQLEAFGSLSQGATGGAAKVAAEIMNVLDKTVEAQVFAYFDEKMPELGEQIRNLMLTFEDLIQLDDRGMQTLLKEIPREDLLLALKTATPPMRQKILGNMSQRAAEILEDDLGSMPPVRVRDVEKAQAAIVAIARRLEEEQKISLGGSGDNALV
jgi:flagellar motor switch protein FliG